jgi:hypothetical protein
MAQKTNLNVSPYFDDFAEDGIGARDKNYYKVLFNPGRAIQARELNTLQSILQNQIDTFGSHFFKDGSVVIPGNIAFDNQFKAVKLNPQQYGVDVESYLKQFEGKKIVGQISGVTATLQLVQLPNSEVTYPTLYVKYIGPNSNAEISNFQDNEPLYCTETVGSIISETPFATTILSNSTSTGSAASIGEGVYFIRGNFVKVNQQTIILDYYQNTPSYRVGLKISENIITPKNDSALYDNAKGFTNYSAPGADRFQILLTLFKKPLDDFNDTDFVELLRVRNGAIQKIELKSQYSIIKDYLAQRTYDESGNYSVDPFQISVNNSLNDRLGNNGIFFSNEKTDKGNTPSDDLMCVKISPGKAYVKGYDIQKNGVEIIDTFKPRVTQNISSANVPFEMGNLLRVNNVTGTPKHKNIVYLQNQRKNSTLVGAGTVIGSARVYNFNLTDASYTGAATNWDLYLYDIQTYTELTLNSALSSTELPKTSYVLGNSSGASGYAVSAGSGTNTITLSQTSGTFSAGESISINGLVLNSRTISNVKVYNIDDIKSVHQPTSISGFTTAFLADTQLDRIQRPGSITITPSSGGISTVTIASPETFSGIKTDAIFRYQRSGVSTEVYNRIVSISNSLNTLTLSGVSTVTGICEGSLPTGVAITFSGYSIGSVDIKNNQSGFLYAELPDQNVSSVNLNSSTISFSAQTKAGFTHSASSSITVSTGDFNLGINSTTARFEAFDEERYSIFYTDGTIENLTSDKVSFPSQSQVTFSNISTNTKTIACINATFVKVGIQSKIKNYNRSKTLNITLSKNPQSGVGVNTSTDDGLTYNKYYGLRVQDEEISLNYPDVYKIIAVYESLDTTAPTLDQISFNSTADVTNNSIIGENIIGNSSNAVARIVTKPSANTLGIVYLNGNKFVAGETVTFEESNINTQIVQILSGKYRNITSKFTLDKGQKEQYYDYSKLVRKNGEASPSRQLLVIFDYYSVPSNDNGDVFTVNSYNEERFSSDIPTVGPDNVRVSDTLDFRPRVSVFTDTTKSPFDFDSRTFSDEPKLIVSPNEGSLLGYDFYLGRIDKVYLDRFGVFTVLQGNPSINPQEPSTPADVMEIATITLPPYLYDYRDATISLVDNRRYTMRDIGKIEDRVENLERVTSLSLLELNTQTLQIQDAQGINRFKTGFFVDDFKNTNLINQDLSRVEVNSQNNELTTVIARNSLNLIPVTAENITNEDLDLSENYTLFDSNVQKSNEVVTLKYESVNWIEQNFATTVENVNPFEIISYSGRLQLNPSSDTWVRTIKLEDILIPKTKRVASARLRGTTKTVEDIVTATVSKGKEEYMRSRNVEFSTVGLIPFTRFYQFLDGSSGVDFIPKLLEISPDSTLQTYGSAGTFRPGELVIGTINNQTIIKFRVANSNHKEGPFNNPAVTFDQNPYVTSESIPPSYSPSSKTLNVDTTALSEQVQGLYSGYVTTGTKLVGQTSGAVAYVKDLKLISDAYGFLAGSFYLRDPLTSPPPPIRISTGSKVYQLSTSSTNETPLPGSTQISSAQTIYKSEGTWKKTQRTITTTVITYYDPVAQSFIVGAGADVDNGNTPNEDINGAFLTSVDLYFASKDSNNKPLGVEVRSVEFSTPTKTILGNPVTLTPDQINVSSDASVPTRVTFDYPIYLAPGQYCIVLLAPQSKQYEVWTAIMGEVTIETKNLPLSQQIKHAKQFGMGRFYKSQNGSEWTGADLQDLKFKLYKAKFTSNSGSVLFHNPTLNESNSYIPTLGSNPITILPKKISLGITTVTDSGTIGILTTGRKVGEDTKTYVYGTIVGTGCSASSVGITTGGLNYADGVVSTYNITGSGKNLTLNITQTNGVITGSTIVNPGTGYAIGDVVGIVTSTVSSNSGSGAKITISGNNNGVDTLYLSNVQGSFTNPASNIDLVYYDNSGTRVSMANTDIISVDEVGGLYSGKFFKVNHFDHGMYSNVNKLTISDIQTNIPPTTLTSPVLTTDTTISVASTSEFSNFEGAPIDPSNNPGFIKIGNEIMKYTNVGSGTLTVVRGVNSTKVEEHSTNDLVYKHEIGGVSLLRVNKTHDISDIGIEIDGYHIEIDRANSTNITNRSNDNSLTDAPQLSFNSELSCGGDIVTSTENIQFNNIIPHVSLINPASPTSVSSQIRTTSGTSVNGTESSFIDQGYEDVGIDVENNLSSTRIICSNVNEQTYLGSLLRGKSFTLKVDLETTDSNLSPMIFWKETSVELLNNRLNKPISDYIGDSRVNSILNDPHAAVYVSNTVRLANPASALKVLVSAFKHSSSDFRVLYSLIRPDSSEVAQSFELFPGYNNLTTDNNLDGYLDVVDPSKNSGLPDVFVPDSLDNQFLEYEFTASNLGKFIGYTIKIVMSGTDQAYAPRFKDLRSIAIA